MIVLKPVATAQTLKFIGRVDSADVVVLRDEQDNTEVEIDSTFIMDSYYLTSNLIFDLKEGRFYNLTVYKSLVSDYKIRVATDLGTFENSTCIEDVNTYNRQIIYKDKIFCTSQSEDSYSINDGDYIEHSSNNDYITT
jgi:hypothetical protein